MVDLQDKMNARFQNSRLGRSFIKMPQKNEYQNNGKHTMKNVATNATTKRREMKGKTKKQMNKKS